MFSETGQDLWYKILKKKIPNTWNTVWNMFDGRGLP